MGMTGFLQRSLSEHQAAWRERAFQDFAEQALPFRRQVVPILEAVSCSRLAAIGRPVPAIRGLGALVLLSATAGTVGSRM